MSNLTKTNRETSQNMAGLGGLRGSKLRQSLGPGGSNLSVACCYLIIRSILHGKLSVFQSPDIV